MRKAAFDHSWAKCRNPENSCLWVKGIVVQHTGRVDEICVASHLTALIGPNGAGKTGFLRALGSLLAGSVPSVSRSQILAVHGKFRGNDFSVIPGKSGPPVGLVTQYIDASLDLHSIQNYVASQVDFDDVIKQYGFGEVKKTELELYRHVCNRNYTAVSIAEIEGPTKPSIMEEPEDEIVYPFFAVNMPDISYDCRSMGFGELCAFYIIWKACRAPKGSVLLLDEPDSHLSPASRRALFDVLAHLAIENGLWILFTSHAVETLHVMQENEMHLIDSQDGGATTRVDPVAAKRNVLRALGLAPLRRLLIVVEDVDAEEVVRQILNRWGDDFASSAEVKIVSGGATEVVRFVSLFPTDSKICHVVAVLDGDKKVQFSGEKRVLFLPTAEDPVHAARLSVSANAENFAILLGVDSQKLKSSIANISHIDHHDFCSGLIENLRPEGIRVSEVRTALMRAWLSTESISSEAMKLSESLLKRIDLIPLNM